MPDDNSGLSIHIGGPPDFQAILAMDGLHFDGARRALADIPKLERGVARAKAKMRRLEDQCAAIEARHAEDDDTDEDVPSAPDMPPRNEPSLYDEIEPIAIQMESLSYDLGIAYGPYLRQIASVHILSAACLEAHINMLAQERLCEPSWLEFERFKLSKKWKRFPRLLGLPGFIRNQQPYAGFLRLVIRRNDLMHYKPRFEPWVIERVPEFIVTLGLTLEAAHESLAVAKAMVEALAAQLGEEPPAWLANGNVSYFKIAGAPRG